MGTVGDMVQQGGLVPTRALTEAIHIGDVSAAFPFPVLETERVVNYPINGTDAVVFFKPGIVSALNKN